MNTPTCAKQEPWQHLLVVARLPLHHTEQLTGWMLLASNSQFLPWFLKRSNPGAVVPNLRPPIGMATLALSAVLVRADPCWKDLQVIGSFTLSVKAK